MTEEKVLEAIELARNTGKIRKGVNEATKALERGTAKLVAVAKDVSPAEIVMHMPLLAKEKGIPFFEVKSREELGTAAGLTVPTAAVAIVKEGDAADILREIAKSTKPEAEPETKAEEKTEEPKTEKPKAKKEKPAKAEEKPAE